MKRTLLFTLLISGIAFAQNVNIPDGDFKAYLVGNSAINTNSDTEIQVSEATAFSGQIDCQNLGITNLTGIEAFTSLTGLYCAGNPIASLDVSSNTNLSILYCPNNYLTSLNVANNSLLTELYCFGNPLTSLNVALNPELQMLDISFTSIEDINLSNNNQLASLTCINTLITSLDLTSNQQLYELYCWDNSISSIIFPVSSTLEFVEVYNNQLLSLDLSSVSNLKYLTCQNNVLSSLNLANGNNAYITNLNTTNNPNLNCIQVDDAIFSSTNWIAPNYNFDAGANFNEDCSATNGLVETEKTVISIFPNPASSLIHIETAEPTEVILLDIDGKELFKSTVSSAYELNISEWNNGIYFIHTAEGHTVKFVKQ